MEKYVWLFPLIFIFHDMEEIIGFKAWLKKNKSFLDSKYPNISKTYQNFSTEGFAFAVFEELILCIIFCILAVTLNSNYIWYLWLGEFIACTLHFIIHIGQAIMMKRYIPAIITSIICLPLSILIIIKCLALCTDQVGIIITFIVIGIIIVALNLKFAQSLIGKFTIWMNNKEKM